MRPIKLIMQAFGPYAGKEVIDFTQLANHTMFVISGKTGSGKTTIFDGISYAIYGKASGDDRTGAELRSHFAKEDLITEVELTFVLRNRTYVVCRSPQQLKKKERGDGYTTTNAKAELSVMTEAGEKQLLASSIREVDEKVNELMQMDSNQFRQIVMIPQGEFRKLLTSDSKEKEVILQRLFRTELYKRIEEKLKEESSALKRTVEQQTEQRTQLLQDIHVQMNEQLKEELSKDILNDQIILPLLQEEITAMKSELLKQNKKIENDHAKRDLLNKRLLEGQEIIKQLEHLQHLEQQKVKLENERENYTQKELSLQLARKASLLEHQEQLCHRLKRNVDAFTAQKTASEENVTKLTALLGEKERAYEREKAREKERNEKLADINRFKMMHDDVHSFAKLQEEVVQLEAQIQTADRERQLTEERLENLEKFLKQLQTEKESIEKGQLRFVENERALDQCRDHLDKLNKFEIETSKLVDRNTRLSESKQKRRHIVARYEDGKALVDELERRRHQGQATVLAGTLKPGCACPVCGSLEHPQPASEYGDGIPSETDMKAAKNDLTKLEREKEIIEKQTIQIQSEVDLQQNVLKEVQAELATIWPEFSPKQLRALKSTVQERQIALKTEQKKIAEQTEKLSGIATALEKHTAEQTKVREKLKEGEQYLHMLKNTYTVKHTTLTRMISTIPESVRTVAAYERTLHTMQSEWEKMNERLNLTQNQFQQASEQLSGERARLEHSKQQLHRATQELHKERTTFKSKMEEQGFVRYEIYHDAKRTEQEIVRLETDIRHYREELRSITDRHHELANVLKHVEKPNLEKLLTEIDRLEKNLKELQTAYTHIHHKQMNNEEIAKKVTQLNEKLIKHEARYRLVGHLSDMARGQNTLRITFERFVLAAFLDEILMEANVRLSKMTSGRYQMLRKTDRSKGNVQSGLELLIFDQYTGQERHVKTLSGGESFKASLSLALGLADVVQEHAGGVSLETMFIDEGFGTLDAESLEQAIESLIDIQSSGRLVGVISHVPELKERIDARLEVIGTQTGSRTEFHFLNG